MKKMLTVLTAAAAATTLATGCDAIDAESSSESGFDISVSSGSEGETVTAELVRIIDGDTVAVAADEEAGLPATNDAGTEHSVRLLGIDSTEMNFYSDQDPDCAAQEATDHLFSAVGDLEAEGSVEVELVYDENSDTYDAYDRSLAYLEHNGTDLNAMMVEDGFAVAWYPDFADEPGRYSDYQDLELNAAEADAGGWGLCEDFEQIARD